MEGAADECAGVEDEVGDGSEDSVDEDSASDSGITSEGASEASAEVRGASPSEAEAALSSFDFVVSATGAAFGCFKIVIASGSTVTISPGDKR